MPAAWLQGGTLNIPGLSSLLSPTAISPPLIPNTSETSKKTLNSLPWPGIDVIIDSYRKYNQGNLPLYIINPFKGCLISNSQKLYWLPLEKEGQMMHKYVPHKK